MGRKYQKIQLPSSLLKGLLAGLMTTLLIAIVTASLISVETIGEETGNLGVMAAILIGSMITALVAGGKTDKMRFVMCLGGCAAYYLTLVCCAPILFDGVKSGVAPGALLALGGGLIAVLLGRRKEKQHRYKLPKMRK